MKSSHLVIFLTNGSGMRVTEYIFSKIITLLMVCEPFETSIVKPIATDFKEIMNLGGVM